MKKTVFIFTLAIVLALMLVTTAPAGTALKHILKKGELVVGIAGSQPPLNATTKTGEIIGLDADIAKLIAMNLGVKLKFAAMPFAELLSALEAGKVDLILSSMTMTPERNQKVAFVGPYFVSGKGILTNNQTAAALNNPEGLNNPEFTLAALKNSTSQMFVEKAAPKARIVKVKSYDEAVQLLSKGEINALIADYPFCAFSAFRYRDKGLLAGQAQLTFEPLGIAVPEDTLLINLLQNFLATLNGTGQLKRLQERWLKDGSWIKELP